MGIKRLYTTWLLGFFLTLVLPFEPGRYLSNILLRLYFKLAIPARRLARKHPSQQRRRNILHLRKYNSVPYANQKQNSNQSQIYLIFVASSSKNASRNLLLHLPASSFPIGIGAGIPTSRRVNPRYSSKDILLAVFIVSTSFPDKHSLPQ